jgi:hypothetical protein
MWRSCPIGALMMLGACHAGPPRDCAVVIKQAGNCISRFKAGDDRDMLLSCFPFSKPQNINGAWYVGFETNVFLEGQRAKAGVPRFGAGHTELEYDDRGPNDGRLRAFDVRLIGRRSECPMGYPEQKIIVDKMADRVLRFVTG